MIDLNLQDWTRCIELIDKYADLGLGLVDASVISIAERLGVTTIATLNHRDFRAYILGVAKPRHVSKKSYPPVDAALIGEIRYPRRFSKHRA